MAVRVRGRRCGGPRRPGCLPLIAPHGEFERGTLDIGVRFVRGYRGPVHVIDRTNREAVRVMREEHGRLLATGAAVAKADFGEELPADAVYADGTPGARMHSLVLLDGPPGVEPRP